MALDIAVLMGSDSDYVTMKKCCDIFDEMEISYIKDVVSAHRTPDLLDEIIKNIEEQGGKIIIAGAGKAAHLPGVIASKSKLPVIGVPMQTKMMGGLDSLLSIVQMPSGIPVGCMGVGNSGAANAAVFAIEILALSDSQIAQKLIKYRNKLADKVKNGREKIKDESS